MSIYIYLFSCGVSKGHMYHGDERVLGDEGADLGHFQLQIGRPDLSNERLFPTATTAAAAAVPCHVFCLS